MKISHKIEQQLKDEANKDRTFYSFEYFPPRTEEGTETLIDRIERMGATNPSWVDVTWNAGGTTSETTLDLCSHIQAYSGLDVMMHLTCTYMTREKVIESLEKAKAYGIKNILALRGDPPRGATDWVHNENGFNYAIDLVRFIKENYGDHFCIVVAGYPEVHLQATSREDDIRHLKEKVDAGADIIITQLFFDNQIFFDWVKDCREAGIKALIIPGLMPILGYERFHKMIKFTKTKVPQFIYDMLEPIKNDDEKVRDFGIKFGIEQTQQIMEQGFRYIHYYTMNLETTVLRIIEGAGIVKRCKELPFKVPACEERKQEQVRPIFWAIKPKSYIAQTHKWDEFPNGRWGVSRSPSFSIEKEEGFVSFGRKIGGKVENKRKMWGQEVTTIEHIAETFCKYLNCKIKKLPFSEGENIHKETCIIRDILLLMNQNFLFTINSQPKVNGVPSKDKIYGWGPDNGYVYQKAYFEFFVPAPLLEPLVNWLKKDEQISYQAMNFEGVEIKNVSDDDVNAVTWGVFPAKEIIQPTVVDHASFKFWKDEAFRSWMDKWAAIYEKESESYAFLQKVHDSFFLVNVVHNDYIGGDLSKFFEEFITQHKELINSIKI